MIGLTMLAVAVLKRPRYARRQGADVPEGSATQRDGADTRRSVSCDLDASMCDDAEDDLNVKTLMSVPAESAANVK